jgi:peptidoglycan/LPS O-acetylase OafA/YrhL
VSRAVAFGAVMLHLHLGGDDTDWHFLFFYACFLAGSLLADPPPGLRELRDRVGAWPPAVLTAAAAVPTCYVMGRSVVTDHTDRTPVMVLYAVAALLLGRGLALLLVDTPAGRWLASLGPMTIVVFLAHTAFLAAVPTPTRSIWLSLLVTFAVTLLAVEVVRRHEEAWLVFDVRRGYRAVRHRARTAGVPAAAGERGDLRGDLRDGLRGTATTDR